MRRNQTSSIIVLIVFTGLSLLYIAIPNDPVSGALQRFVFGIDNAFENEAELPSLEADNRIAQLEAENERLRTELGFAVYTQNETIAANVAAKSVQNYRSTIDLDVGSERGVSVGQSVMSRGQLIGRIVWVGSNRSTAVTLHDPDFRAAAIIEGTNIDGLVRPVPGGVVFDQVPDPKASERAGQRIVTSGLGGLFQPGLLIGTVGDNISAENAIFRELIVESSVDVRSVSEVIILQ